MIMTRLNWIEKAQELTERLATPHRLFDVDGVRKDAGNDDPLVGVQPIFVEYANTGCRSPLERFICTVLSDDGEPVGVSFMVDLIQGLTDLQSAATGCSSQGNVSPDSPL